MLQQNDEYQDRINKIVDRHVKVKNKKKQLSPQFKLPKLKINFSPQSQQQYSNHKNSIYSGSNKFKQTRITTEIKENKNLVEKAKRNRSISNMVSKHSLISSTQYGDDDKILSPQRIQKNKIHRLRLDLLSELQMESEHVVSLRHPQIEIVDYQKVDKIRNCQRNHEEQLILLDQLYKKNDKLVHNYIQIRNEAQLLDQRIKNIQKVRFNK